MAWTARRCVPVVSSWVDKLIQGCDDEFAIRFKRYGGVPGVTCYYPQAPAAFFNLALAWPSKGRFVWRFLYRLQPYQIIADSCPPGDCPAALNCCPSVTLPASLRVTYTGSGFCLDGVTVPIAFQGSATWSGNYSACGGASGLDFSCVEFPPGSGVHLWQLAPTLGSHCTFAPIRLLETSCDPFLWSNPGTLVDCGLSGGSYTITVTE